MKVLIGFLDLNLLFDYNLIALSEKLKSEVGFNNESIGNEHKVGIWTELIYSVKDDVYLNLSISLIELSVHFTWVDLLK